MFSTSLNPGSAGAALEAIRIIKSEPEIRTGLNKVVLTFLKKIPAPFRVPPDHRTPIIPLILKDAKLTMRASRKLLDLGYLVPGIRPPSVPYGTSRLRISLKNGLTEKQLNNFTQALAETISDL
jgi:8-amino-7-oxononanoate synthase